MHNRLLDETTELTEQTARRLIDALDRTGATRPVRLIRGHQVVSAFLGAIGLALFVVGIERAAADIPFVSNAYGSIFVGLLLLITTGALLTRLGGRDAPPASPATTDGVDRPGDSPET
jgi:hypothetical protein